MKPPSHSIRDTIWTVIPVKPFDEGKSRLGLDDETRAATNRAFLDHVLGVARSVLPAANIVVVSRDDAALILARSAGARGLLEAADNDDLNDALTVGATFAQKHGAAAVLSLFADLPDLVPGDIDAMIAEFNGDNLVIAPDERGSGSNALLMVPNALPYRHGPDSLWRHLQAARETRVDFAIVRRAGLMRDVDTPAQYAALTGDRRPERGGRMVYPD